MIKSWQHLSSRELGNYRIFKVLGERRVSPRTGAEHEFFVLDTMDWVNVVAVTPNKELVLVEQYRHGTQEVELELPGGIMDPEDESPLITGARELQEETGYSGGQAVLLSSAPANPALMNNQFHCVYVPDCRQSHELELDHAEDIVTRIVPLTEVSQLIQTGHFRHPLMITALVHFFRHTGEDPKLLLG